MVDLRLDRDWRTGTDVLDALRSSFVYPASESRATGYLYAEGEQAWPAAFEAVGPSLINDLVSLVGIRFKIVAFQGYRDGTGCDWHSDDAFTVQAILSLGVTRTFGIRRRVDGSSETMIALHHGDLIFMPPGFQAEWQHCVPVEEVNGERCSLVFRSV